MLFLVIMNMLLAVYATPVIDTGDESVYIMLSKTFLGEATSVDPNYLQYRSPLYSIIMAGFMLFFNPPFLYKVMVIFQYILVAVTAWMVYLIFKRLFLKKEWAMLAALLFNLSFSTIYYANVILTETLAAFLLVLSVNFLLKFDESRNLKWICALGVSFGLLSLARFNAIPLFTTFCILLAYILIKEKVPFKKLIVYMGTFVFSMGLIIGGWELFNYHHYGKSRFINNAEVGVPKSPRKVIIASIRSGNTVSEKNKPLLDIFLKTRKEYLARETPFKKGSLMDLDKMDFLIDLYSGVKIYQLAKPALQSYLELAEKEGSSDIRPDLDEFLREIAAQNRWFLIKYKFLSFLNGLRPASGGSLSIEHGKSNLNILPSSAFVVFKLLFLFVSIFVFIAFLHLLYITIKTRSIPDVSLLVLFFIVMSFWLINFIYSTANDANRFKFPAEPLIIGLFVFYIHKLIMRLAKTKHGNDVKEMI